MQTYSRIEFECNSTLMCLMCEKKSHFYIQLSVHASKIVIKRTVYTVQHGMESLYVIICFFLPVDVRGWLRLVIVALP